LILHSPVSTLFPYTTLFRSFGSDLLKLDWSALTSGAQGANYTAFDLATGSGTLTTSDPGFKVVFTGVERFDLTGTGLGDELRGGDRKSTRLNSSHSQISYAV